MIDDIKKGIEEGRFDIFEPAGFVKKRACGNPERLRISASVPIDASAAFGLNVDMVAEFLAQLRRSVSDQCHKKIFGSLSDSERYSVRDLRGIPESMVVKELISEIKNSGFRYVLVGSRIATILQDSREFVISSDSLSSISKSNSNVHMIGSIYGYQDVYLDPYMKWNDSRVMLFSEASALASGIKLAEVADEATFAPRIIIEMSLEHSVGDSMVLYVRDDGNPDLDPGLMARMRGQKIDKLLDEEDKRS